jgi:hypothetical protein
MSLQSKKRKLSPPLFCGALFWNLWKWFGKIEIWFLFSLKFYLSAILWLLLSYWSRKENKNKILHARAIYRMGENWESYGNKKQTVNHSQSADRTNISSQITGILEKFAQYWAILIVWELTLWHVIRSAISKAQKSAENNIVSFIVPSFTVRRCVILLLYLYFGGFWSDILTFFLSSELMLFHKRFLFCTSISFFFVSLKCQMLMLALDASHCLLVLRFIAYLSSFSVAMQH